MNEIPYTLLIERKLFFYDICCIYSYWILFLEKIKPFKFCIETNHSMEKGFLFVLKCVFFISIVLHRCVMHFNKVHVFSDLTNLRRLLSRESEKVK